MTGSEYQSLAIRTCAIPYEFKEDMLYHALFGLNSEAGEVAGILQKKYQGHPVDREHIKKEERHVRLIVAYKSFNHILYPFLYKSFFFSSLSAPSGSFFSARILALREKSIAPESTRADITELMSEVEYPFAARVGMIFLGPRSFTFASLSIIRSS